MAVHTSIDQNDTQGTISVSVKGIPTEQGQALREVSKAREVNLSTLLREMVNMTMGSTIHVFCLKSPLVASLDQDIAHFTGGTYIPAWNSVPMAPQFESAYRELLGISTEDDLTKILLRNAQYLRMRASQVLPRGQQIFGGLSMHFALFCEIAGRDENTIEAYWASIARFWGAWYRRQDYYSQINQLRGVLSLEPADGLSEARAKGIYSRAVIFQGESGEKGQSQVLLTLRTENTRALPVGAIDLFFLPPCNGHILAPNPGYGAPVIYSNNVLGMGFRFLEESCSLHCYSVDDARIGDTQTLSEVANALVDGVDETLRAYAATIPVHQK
ncbi:hypothetical protein [Dickeya dianthicola]|uniref:hypothetical protein n=1 Tax=Dickeya dianthicola TaxID=204039 RepID=UPI0003AA4B81|nr:hypothetical protein [Dickeya dianthicola]MCI4031820.1 hypothetical protein [Dickeya dianthicola]MCI4175198.1 hypothetical protein [Dickeya dianthicola]MCI4179433.1 hypothetical protein [Dickeya dianthicola]MCI4182392.1 hypothetical protein [Dickeya dianthicola]MCI4196778.1 hypothetical protein [Dickeya dianthicola]